MHADSACPGNGESLQHHGVTVPPNNLIPLSGRHRTKTPSRSGEIDRRIRAGWMSFRRYLYTQELYGRPEAGLLHLKDWRLKPEVVEALLHGCTTWIPLRGHYNELRTAHCRMLLRTLEAWYKSPNSRIFSYKGTLQ